MQEVSAPLSHATKQKTVVAAAQSANLLKQALLFQL